MTDYTPNQLAAEQLRSLALEISSGAHGTVANVVIVIRLFDNRPGLVIGIGEENNPDAAFAALQAGMADMEAAQIERQ